MRDVTGGCTSEGGSQAERLECQGTPYRSADKEVPADQVTASVQMDLVWRRIYLGFLSFRKLRHGCKWIVARGRESRRMVNQKLYRFEDIVLADEVYRFS